MRILPKIPVFEIFLMLTIIFSCIACFKLGELKGKQHYFYKKDGVSYVVASNPQNIWYRYGDGENVVLSDIDMMFEYYNIIFYGD